MKEDDSKNEILKTDPLEKAENNSFSHKNVRSVLYNMGCRYIGCQSYDLIDKYLSKNNCNNSSSSTLLQEMSLLFGQTLKQHEINDICAFGEISKQPQTFHLSKIINSILEFVSVWITFTQYWTCIIS